MVDSARAGQCDDTRAASRDDGQTRIWSTDQVPLRERFSYWREVVCNATAGLFGTPTEASPGVFSAHAAFRSCGPFRFMVAEAKTNYWIARTHRDVARAPSDYYAIYLQLCGETISFRGEEFIQLHAGDIGFCAPQAYRAEHGGRCAIAMVPRAMMERRAPWLRGRPHRKLASNARFANHLRWSSLMMLRPWGQPKQVFLPKAFATFGHWRPRTASHQGGWSRSCRSRHCSPFAGRISMMPICRPSRPPTILASLSGPCIRVSGKSARRSVIGCSKTGF